MHEITKMLKEYSYPEDRRNHKELLEVKNRIG